MRIVLIGYMGSGKSTIGKLLAEKLELDFNDLDNYIENKSGTTIPDIFKEKGEIYFRKIEHEYLNEILENESRLVLATGGGTPCYSGNMHAMLERSNAVIYLKMSIPRLIDRLSKEKDERPLIAHLEDKELPEFIGKHLFERSPFYAMAEHTILCDDKRPAEIVSEIQRLLV
ncbi:shikimate kinase [Muriicola sp. Z0-33]|uniref:shikimate kinase n=1 Tax=Muriicola sp. Z0-33 TaxID=2816957 RepID=UPI0022372F58|nr:shikimate kinase [Muriicola sp. Z0-33]MCW5517310.1 shikimate kinase [Muriicola sp. Z0-33]